MTVDDRPREFDHEVAVVGGGPAGCSAGVFTARDGLETAVFDRGRSSIRRCAYLENYLGFPAGIDVDTFCALAREHAEEVGCTYVPDLVESVERRVDGDGFVLALQERGRVTARFVIAATKYDGAYLRPLDDEGAMFETADGEGDGDRFDSDYPGDDGRTPVPGLYVAGPLAGAGDQAIVAAGHGADVARTLLADLRRRDGYRGRFAERYDWVRQAEELSDEWADRERWEAWFDDEVPADCDLEPDAIERLRDSYVDDRLAQYVEPGEIERRRRRGHRRLAAHLSEAAMVDAVDDETMLEAIDDEAILAYAGDLEADRAESD